MSDGAGHPFGLPAIQDLTAREEPPMEPLAADPADLIFLSRRQADRVLADVPETDDLPESATPALLLIPWGRGALAVPYCPSPEREVKCQPIKGGPDDNPLTWSCSCTGPRTEREEPLPEPVPPEPQACDKLLLKEDLVQPIIVCVEGTCEGKCEPVKTGLAGIWQLWCRCVGARPPSPLHTP